jgi:hypothetical protein
LREIEKLEYKSLAAEILFKILHDRIRVRMKVNPWKFRSFYEKGSSLIVNLPSQKLQPNVLSGYSKETIARA